MPIEGCWQLLVSCLPTPPSMSFSTVESIALCRLLVAVHVIFNITGKHQSQLLEAGEKFLILSLPQFFNRLLWFLSNVSLSQRFDYVLYSYMPGPAPIPMYSRSIRPLVTVCMAYRSTRSLNVHSREFNRLA